LYSEAIKLAPDQPKWYYGLLDSLEALEDEDTYKTSLLESAKHFPEDVKLGVRLLRFYTEQGSCRDVVRVYKAASAPVKADKSATVAFDACAWLAYVIADGQYQEIAPLSGGFYKAKMADKYGYLAASGNLKIANKYDEARSFIDGWAAVKAADEWYFIDQEGDRIQAFSGQEAQDLYSFSQGYAVAKVDGKYGFVNTDLKQFAFKYSDARPFYHGVAPVKKDGHWGLIDLEFNEIVKPQFDDVACTEAGLCTVQDRIFFQQNDEWKLYNLKGERVGKSAWTEVIPFAQKTAVGLKGEKWEVLDRSGKVVASSDKDQVRPLERGAMPVRADEEWSYTNQKGQALSKDRFTDAFPVSEDGTAIVGTEKGYTVIQFMGLDESD
jgi:hypothetical protein